MYGLCLPVYNLLLLAKGLMLHSATAKPMGTKILSIGLYGRHLAKHIWWLLCIGL
jgi:hypothetical protein